MAFDPVQPQKTRELRERYRKARRRQQALLLLGGCGIVLLVLVVWLTGMAFRSAASRNNQVASTGRPARRRSPRLSATAPTKVVGKLSFATAPWKLDVDADAIYACIDAQKRRPAGDVLWPCDGLSASPVQGGKPFWQVPRGQGVSEIDVAGSTAVVLSRDLASQRIDLNAYRTADGKSLWHVRPDSSILDSALRVTGKLALVTGKQTKSYSLLAYDSQTGRRPWVVKLPFRALRQDYSQNEADDALQRYDTSNYVVYARRNVVGAVDILKGKLHFEYAAAGTISSVVLEEQTQTVYLLVRGKLDATSIVSLSLSDGKAHALEQLAPVDPQVLLVPGPQWLLTCYRQGEGAGAELKLDCLPLGEHGQQPFVGSLAGMHAMCAAVLPTAPGTFLVGVTADSSPSGVAQGAKQFYLVSPAAGSVAEVGQAAQPVVEVLPFKGNLLALSAGGELYQFEPARRRFRRLVRLRYPQCGMLQSDDRSTLLVYGTTDKWFDNEPGQPMQVVTLQ